MKKLSVLLLVLMLSGCGWPPLPPEAWVEIAKREVSVRAVGMLGVEPQTGTVFCMMCYLTYSRNMPNPDPTRTGITPAPIQSTKPLAATIP